MAPIKGEPARGPLVPRRTVAARPLASGTPYELGLRPGEGADPARGSDSRAAIDGRFQTGEVAGELKDEGWPVVDRKESAVVPEQPLALAAASVVHAAGCMVDPLNSDLGAVPTP